MGSEWLEKTIGDVCYVTDGAHSKVSRVEEGVMYLTSKNIGNGKLKLDKFDYITEESHSKLFTDTKKSQRRLRTGDVLMGIIGTFGNCYVYKEEDWFGISSSVAILRPIQELVLPEYLYYVISSEKFKATVNKFKGGSVQGYTNIATLKALPILIPSIEVQRNIVNTLMPNDKKIYLNQQTNQTLEQMAQALFKSWFVDFDPVIDNALAAGNTIPDELQARAELRQRVIAERTTNPNIKPLPEDIQHLFPSEFEESELGWIPRGWESLSIHDLVDSVSITYKLKEVDEVIFLNTGDIEDGKLLHKNYSKTEGLPGQAKKSIVKGDILYSEIRPKNKRFALVNIDCSDYVVSTKLMVLRAKVDIDSLLPYFILTQEKTIQNLQHVAEHRSGTFPQITFKELADVTATLPKANTLVDYFVSNYLKPFYDKQFSSVTQNEQLEKLRDTLLPKLISGDLKINRDVA
jgi:type I restriction enzyme S subunit